MGTSLITAYLLQYIHSVFVDCRAKKRLVKITGSELSA